MNKRKNNKNENFETIFECFHPVFEASHVVNVIDENIVDFHDCFWNVSFFHKKTNNQFVVVTVFPMKSDIFLDVSKTFLLMQIDETCFC